MRPLPRTGALAAVLLAWGALGSTPHALRLSEPPEYQLLRHATDVLEHVLHTPRSPIPASTLLRARALAVVPAAVRHGAVYHGTGALSARGGGFEAWTPPAIFTFEGRIPVQLEAETLDFVLIAQTPRGLDYFAQEHFTTLREHPFVPGPLGHAYGGRRADVVAYVRFGDYFAGIDVHDWEIAEVPDSHLRLYGRAYSIGDILRGAGFFHLPAPARDWRRVLAAYFEEMS